MPNNRDAMKGRTIRPRKTTDPLPEKDTPFSAEELSRMEGEPAHDELVSRLLATIRQRERIIAEMDTRCDPAGTHRELVELRDLVGQLARKIEEMKR